MKKTLVALSVLAAAANVNAAEIYSTDTSKVSLKGEVDAYVATKDIEVNNVRTETDPFVTVWGKIQLDAEHKVNDSLTSFASFEIESTTGAIDEESNNNAKFDDMYIGVKTDVWGVAIGEVGDLAASTDVLEKGDITNEGEYLGAAGGHRNESKGNGIVFKAELTDGLVFVADVNTEASETIDNTYGVSLDWAINDMFSVGASIVNGEQAQNVDYQLAGLGGSVSINDFYFAATYVQFEGVNSFGLFGSEFADETAFGYEDGSAYGIAASYTINKTRLYTTYDIMSLDEATISGANSDGDVRNLVIGVDYAVMDNVTIFGEFQTAETTNDFTGSPGKGQDADTFVLGTYYTF
ncbi:porin [Vibrio ostreicida]|uniref:porin n=1 Tax=Vibrio ostreicida TaxID=526588 RepID=UPI00097122EB|nr:porin [Vibrio ostreicida]